MSIPCGRPRIEYGTGIGGGYPHPLRPRQRGTTPAGGTGMREWGHTLISDYFIDNKRQFYYLVCHDKTMAHRI
ncbi:MAG: hypothetical protein Q6355_09665 [Candidatus Brocadiales bacterium]|uniref:hypothetical protein n=1 Tax=Candidatus Wujingus californicus TaxID=3367618 RepID=UPI00271370EE|nr:hypothetical protein [Candidatus Brocadiales bacterium]